MNKKSFYFEIHDLLNQFVAAFDDVVISRFNKQRVEQEQIKVRYVHAPKQKVVYDLNNKAQNLTLPVISINVSSIDRDESRVFNKITGMYIPTHTRDEISKTSHIKMPVPVNLSVSMSIIASYQSDLEQIISNFIPYTNPYLIISWKIPTEFNVSYIQEIRSEVLWSGSCSLEYPVDSTASDKVRFTATTSFTIKGWLFPQADKDLIENIYFVKNNFRTTTNVLMNSEDYYQMQSDSSSNNTATYLLNETEYAHVSGSPTLTNLYRLDKGGMIELSGHNVTKNETNLLVLGKRFKYNCFAVLSTISAISGLPLSSYSYEYFPTISGYPIDPSSIKILTENTLQLKISSLPVDMAYDIIIVNDIGWASTLSINTRLYSVTF